MSSRRHILGLCLLGALPVAVEPVFAAPAESAVGVCCRLVQESREVDRLLRTVSDRESGVAAAAELRTRLEYMRQATEQLGRLPISSGEEARSLEQMMRDLTHITQGYMPVVQRLVEVNAYGADELISLFRYYKMSADGGASSSQAQETPLVRAYTEWCDSLDDILFLLRRVQSAETAGTVAAELAATLRKAETRATQAEALRAGLSPQQVESEQIPEARWQRLREELRVEVQRLRSAQWGSSSPLRELVAGCCRAGRI